MKIFKKIMVVLFAAAFSLSSSRRAQSRARPEAAVVIRQDAVEIGVYNGGLGWTWASTACQKI